MDIAEISDRLEILDLYARYVNYVDLPDYDALAERVFVDDTRFDYRDAAGPVMTFAQMRAGGFFDGDGMHRFHITSNLVIDFGADRHTAGTVSKTLNPWAVSDDRGTRLYQVHGRYIDELTRLPQGWRITARRWEHAWVSGWTGDAASILMTMGDVV